VTHTLTSSKDVTPCTAEQLDKEDFLKSNGDDGFGLELDERDDVTWEQLIYRDGLPLAVAIDYGHGAEFGECVDALLDCD
jgi:hypothetical protein